MISRDEVKSWLEEKRGVLVTKSALVHRESYYGNDILAPNSSPEKGDHRGYVPVELWITSSVQADNPVLVEGEGITKIPINGEHITLTHLKEVAEELLFGSHATKWPLTKVLDIGGKPVNTSFGTRETPPIPVHVHGGYIVDGKVKKPGKLEAYFFPPTDIPPYNQKIEVKTRIGFKQNVSKDEFKEKLHEFGKSDAMYELLEVHAIEPMTGWTVPEGVIHAPGPYITFEIQRPQDDYSLASWRLGERLTEEEQPRRYQELVLRGLSNEDDLINEIYDWPATTDPQLRDKNLHKAKLLDEGAWGKRYQIFFDEFYGEGWEILPDQTFSLGAKTTPQAGIVWSGEGTINTNHVSQSGENEFLCIPNTPLQITNTASGILYIYTVEPIRE